MNEKWCRMVVLRALGVVFEHILKNHAWKGGPGAPGRSKSKQARKMQQDGGIDGSVAFLFEHVQKMWLLGSTGRGLEHSIVLKSFACLPGSHGRVVVQPPVACTKPWSRDSGQALVLKTSACSKPFSGGSGQALVLKTRIRLQDENSS